MGRYILDLSTIRDNEIMNERVKLTDVPEPGNGNVISIILLLYAITINALLTTRLCYGNAISIILLPYAITINALLTTRLCYGNALSQYTISVC